MRGFLQDPRYRLRQLRQSPGFTTVTLPTLAIGIEVVSNAVRRQHFGSDASAAGAALKLDGKPYTVIGILPASARFSVGTPSF